LFALGLGLVLAWRELPSRLELQLTYLLASHGGGGCRVAVAEFGPGRRAVGVGLPSNARLTRPAAEALIRAELQLGPFDSLAVVTLPPTAPGPPILELGSLLVLLVGLGGLARQARPRVVAWWKSRQAPPPELEVNKSERCVIQVKPGDVRQTRAALLAWRRQLARERGLLINPIEVRPGKTRVFLFEGTRYTAGGDTRELLGVLEPMIPRLIGYEEVTKMLDQWRVTHPGLIRELTERVPIARLARLMRMWVGRGRDLRALDLWVEALLACGESSDSWVLDKLSKRLGDPSC